VIMKDDYKRMLAATLLFGSLWGFTECIVGSWLYSTGIGIHTGAVMTGFFALGLMCISRFRYGKPGMQLGMSIIAASMRLSYPFGGCFLCSAIAILSEGLIFEVIWRNVSTERDIKGLMMSSSIGVVSGYTIYIGGYIVTQVLTPVVSSAGFYVENLLVFLPQILARGLTAAILGGLTIPLVALITSHLNIKMIDGRLYYPASICISFLCWFSVVLTTLMLIT
jgi:hypothetical protein